MQTKERYRKALVVLSGGQDSTTCLFLAKKITDEVVAITIHYGQLHEIEVDSAAQITRMADVPGHEFIGVGVDALHGSSPLVNHENEVEQYADADVLPGGIEKTFVPMRNALFLTLAANRAVVHGCDVIITGISEEDYGGYPDCRAEFLLAMQNMIKMALRESAECPYLMAPLLHINKAGTVRMAQELPGCMEALAFSHTCYRGEFPPCGHCHACLLRARGFEQVGVPDPLVVRAQGAERATEDGSMVAASRVLNKCAGRLADDGRWQCDVCIRLLPVGAAPHCELDLPIIAGGA